MSGLEQDLGGLLHDIHARMARLETLGLMLTQTMAESGSLPPRFASAFDSEIKRRAESLGGEFETNLKRLGSEWGPTFALFVAESAKR